MKKNIKNSKDLKDKKDFNDKNRPVPKDSNPTPGFIPPHGGFKKLLSFQKAEIVYDATVYFCDRFLSKRDRTCCANVIMGLIKVTRHLLKRQIQSLEKAFVQEGGLRERMTRARLDYRSRRQ